MYQGRLTLLHLCASAAKKCEKCAQSVPRPSIIAPFPL
ncbi:Uncharacterised protein [Yersinia mollaretii]|uniref:Uncharacterized protein n=2 Tax=Yersinia mollaretii TaxID=33060 RepID=A0AA36PPP2_YERMO|nr:hypothetical protein ymoll0001_32640 [Yersinia mollaretii ATCC 43969]CNF61521.1 Uncharacterised protein [Yersinia mollaretii]CNI73508.1 Uncharacterised protein [Yersinia mollaretii]CQJ31895.1 Uncharacterised protein [Yersinia mollaretii]